MSDASLDLDAIENDLNEVERAMERLEDGTYFNNEVTGTQNDGDVLTEHPA